MSLVVDARTRSSTSKPRSSVPETFSSDIRDFVTGVHELDTRLLLVLDAERTLSVTAAADRR